MDEMVEWLRAQLDEDERVAREATCEAWRVTTKSDRPYMEDGEIHTVAVHARWVDDKNPEPYQIVTHGDFHEAVDRADAEHIALHDPARVLREVEAKRRIMAIHRRRTDVFAESGGAFDNCCDGCGYGGICDDPNIEDINDCPELRALAAIYIDRPGYREEWRP